MSGGHFRGPLPSASSSSGHGGHDYSRSPNDSHPVDVGRVHSLISARMNAKITRDFDRADALRMELRALGVEVHDRDKLWFVDRPELARLTTHSRSTPGMGGSGGASGGMGGGMGGGHMRSKRGEPMHGGGGGRHAPRADASAHVHFLLAERLQAKKRKDFEMADRMRDDLRRAGIEASLTLTPALASTLTSALTSTPTPSLTPSLTPTLTVGARSRQGMARAAAFAHRAWWRDGRLTRGSWQWGKCPSLPDRTSGDLEVPARSGRPQTSGRASGRAAHWRAAHMQDAAQL